MEPEAEDLARSMFNAYNAQGPNPWKTHDGKLVPKWEELGEQVQAKWRAAALCAADLILADEDDRDEAEET